MVAYAIVAPPDEELLDEELLVDELLDEDELCPPEEELLVDELLVDDELPELEELPEDELPDELLGDDGLPAEDADCDDVEAEAALSLQPDRDSMRMPDIASDVTLSHRRVDVFTETTVRRCHAPGDVSRGGDVSANPCQIM